MAQTSSCLRPDGFGHSRPISLLVAIPCLSFSPFPPIFPSSTLHVLWWYRSCLPLPPPFAESGLGVWLRSIVRLFSGRAGGGWALENGGRRGDWLLMRMGRFVSFGAVEWHVLACDAFLVLGSY